MGIVDETKTYTLEQVKLLLEASKETRIHMQMVFALLMGLLANLDHSAQ